MCVGDVEGRVGRGSMEDWVDFMAENCSSIRKHVLIAPANASQMFGRSRGAGLPHAGPGLGRSFQSPDTYFRNFGEMVPPV